MIKRLDLNVYETIEKILDLQRRSYIIEAEIIGFYDIPTLKDNIDTIKESGENFYGYFIEGILAGMISYEIDNGIMDICRVAVLPDFFRRGISGSLIDYIECIETEVGKITVCTGKENAPAVNLYTKKGFKRVEDIEVEKGFYMTCFEKENKQM